MKFTKILLAGAVAAAAWGTAQAQTMGYGVDRPSEAYSVDMYSTPSSTGSTPSVENTSAYPKHMHGAGYATREYWDNGVMWQRSDPVVMDSRGNVNYVYPETARLGSRPAVTMYGAPGYAGSPRKWNW